MMLGLGLSGVGFPVLIDLVIGGKVWGDTWQSNLTSVSIQFLFMIFYPGLQAYALKAVRREGPDWGDFFWGWKYPVRILTADLLSSLPLLLILLVGGAAIAGVNAVGVPEAFLFFKYAKYATQGVLGAALLWVLGYVSIRLNQWSLLLIDKGVTARQSVQQSWRLMRAHTLSFLVLLVILALVNCLGALAFLVGVFVTIPVSLGAFAAFYVKISEKAGGA